MTYHLLRDGLQDSLPHRRRTPRVLPRNQLPSLRRHNMRGERILGLLKSPSTVLVQLILERERHQTRRLRLVLLGVGESGDGGVFDEEGAVGELDSGEGGGAVADGGDDFVELFKFADDLVGGGVGGEIEHGYIGYQRMPSCKLSSKTHVRDHQRRKWRQSLWLCRQSSRASQCSSIVTPSLLGTCSSPRRP